MRLLLAGVELWLIVLECSMVFLCILEIIVAVLADYKGSMFIKICWISAVKNGIAIDLYWCNSLVEILTSS